MSIQTLISTMNLKNARNLLLAMNVGGDYVIVNQAKGATYSEKGDSKKIITIDERGLSRSRNLAIDNCTSDIALIADDDIEYVNNYERIIEDGFKNNPDADVIVYYLDSDDEKNKKKRLKEGRIRGIKIFKIASWQIAFKVDAIKKNNIRLDENFGAGSKYIMGEENIFLSDIKNKGLKIYSYPRKIGKVCDKRESTWFTEYNERYFRSRGAGYYRISKILYPFYIAQFAIRKQSIYKKSVFFAIKNMMSGVCEYKRFLRRDRILMVGDTSLNTGPSNANRAFIASLGQKTLVLKRKNKLLRLVELVYKTRKVGAVCFCSFSKINIFGIKVAKVMKKKTSYIVHGCVLFEKAFSDNVTDDMIETEKYVINNVDNVICVSSQLAKKVKEYYSNLGNVNVVYNVAHRGRINRSDMKITRGKNVVLSTGGDWSIKNNIAVCKAIQEINKNSGNTVEYIIAGKVSKPEMFSEYDFVRLVGALPKEEYVEQLKKCSLFVQNSIFDSFPLSTLEAIDFGCDILISKNVGTKEIIDSLDDGDIVNNPNNIQEIAKKISKLLRKGNNERIKKGIIWNKVSSYFVARDLKDQILNVDRKPKVSVIVPVYNSQKYIKRCLHSILRQTYRDIEVIIVDDGSTDDTAKIVDNFLARDRRIRVIKQNNEGANIARGAGVKLAHGEYCVFVDSDDWLSKEAIEKLVKTAVQGYDIVKYNAKVEPRGTKLYEDALFEDYDYDDRFQLLSILVSSYFFSLMTTSMYRTELLLKSCNFELKSSYGEDHIVNMDAYSNASKVVMLNAQLYHYYTLNQNSTTKNSNIDKIEKNYTESEILFSTIITNAKRWGIYDKIEKDILLRILDTEAWLIYSVLTSSASDNKKRQLIDKISSSATMQIIRDSLEGEDIKNERSVVAVIKNDLLNKQKIETARYTVRTGNMKRIAKRILEKCLY